MTTELTMLAWSMVLAFVQILLFDVARTRQYGLGWNMGPRDETMPPLNAMAERLRRAQDNLFETLPLFAAGVLIAHVADRDNGVTALGAELYLCARVVYVPLYAFGVRTIRSLVWTIAVAGIAMIYSAILWPL